jgi:hypothetical protein
MMRLPSQKLAPAEADAINTNFKNLLLARWGCHPAITTNRYKKIRFLDEWSCFQYIATLNRRHNQKRGCYAPILYYL